MFLVQTAAHIDRAGSSLDCSLAWDDIVLLVVGVFGAVIAGVTFALTWKDRRDTRKEAPRKGVRHVTARLEEVATRLNPEGSVISLQGEQVVITNEGSLPVMITSVELGPGSDPYEFLGSDRAVYAVPVIDPKNPVQVMTFRCSLHGLKTFLRQGEELRVPVIVGSGREPRDRNLQQIPELKITDFDGRQWWKCEQYFVDLPEFDPLSVKSRRHRWFERRSWFPSLEQKMFRLARTLTARHPFRPSLLVYLISWLWGWRAGEEPLGVHAYLPKTWKWEFLIAGGGNSKVQEDG